MSCELLNNNKAIMNNSKTALLHIFGGGGIHENCICTLATCTVLWYIVCGGGSCIGRWRCCRYSYETMVVDHIVYSAFSARLCASVCLQSFHLWSFRPFL